MSSGRQYGMNGPQPLSWNDISQYLLLMDEILEPFETRIIRLLDNVWIEEVAKLKEDK